MLQLLSMLLCDLLVPMRAARFGNRVLLLRGRRTERYGISNCRHRQRLSATLRGSNPARDEQKLALLEALRQPGRCQAAEPDFAGVYVQSVDGLQPA